MQIKVTQEHIDKGEKGQGQKCPVALALKEATDLCASIYGSIYLWKGRRYNPIKYEYIAKTPTPVLREIKTFDLTGEMKPFTFEIDYENQNNPRTH